MAGWRCPYCQQLATIISRNVSGNEHLFSNENKDGPLCIRTDGNNRLDDTCREYMIEAALYKSAPDNSGTYRSIPPPLLTWRLKPKSLAPVLPDYIPPAIREDYEEACLRRESGRSMSGALRTHLLV